MNKSEARRLSETVTVSELERMFENAKNSITDWTRVSRVNKGMTIGVSFNLFTKGGIPENIHIMAKKNMIWEFGEYLPGYSRPKKEKGRTVNVVHQEPNFL